MAVVTRLSDNEAKLIAEETLSRELSGIDFQDVTAASGMDQGGDPAIFVTLNMGKGAPTIAGRRLADAHVALLDAMATHGEERHTYLRVDWPDEEVPPSLDVAT